MDSELHTSPLKYFFDKNSNERKIPSHKLPVVFQNVMTKPMTKNHSKCQDFQNQRTRIFKPLKANFNDSPENSLRNTMKMTTYNFPADFRSIDIGKKL